MNRYQKWVLIFFIMATLVIGVFPPWRCDLPRFHRNIGFHFLLSDQEVLLSDQGGDFYYQAQIDTTEIAVEWITLALVCAGLFLLAKDMAAEDFTKFWLFIKRAYIVIIVVALIFVLAILIVAIRRNDPVEPTVSPVHGQQQEAPEVAPPYHQ